MKRKILSLVVLLACISVGYAQKINVISGDVAKLKNQKIINLEYDYADLDVGKKEESVYIQGKVSDYNSDEAGKGDTWEKAWFNDRPTRYQPKFEELLNKYLLEIGITAKPNATEASYTMILKTTMIEPGFNVGVVRKSAGINVEIIIVDNNQNRTSIAKLSMTNVPGSGAMGYDFDSGLRISEAYAKCGKALAKYIIKNLS